MTIWITAANKATAILNYPDSGSTVRQTQVRKGVPPALSGHDRHQLLSAVNLQVLLSVHLDLIRLGLQREDKV